MEVIIQKDMDTAASMTVRIICKALSRKPHLVLGLATGRTMELVYKKLSQAHREEGVDFSLCRTYNLDEYIGLAPESPHSYRSYMNHHLFNNINIDLRNTHVPNGMAKDLNQECLAYENSMKECGGIDLQLLGIGVDGHIGFNEPLSSLRSHTRAKALTPQTMAQNASLFDKPADMPRRAITMGVGTILKSKRALMLVTGKEKAKILAAAVEGSVTSMLTASALQLHQHCTVVTDEDAAVDLQGREYYQWIFDNEPEWEEFRRFAT